MSVGMYNKGKVIGLLRSSKNTENVTIITLTFENSLVSKFNAINAGADDYLLKPLMVDKLLRIITSKI